MEELKKPIRNRRKEDPPFRRKEDELKFNLFDKFLSLMKWLIALVILILFFFYRTIGSQNQTDQYQIKLLNELTEKVNSIAINQPSSKSVVPGTCLVCHPFNSPSELRRRSDLQLDNFKAYIRGTYRPISNTVMPKFDSSAITDKEIEDIYNFLKPYK